MLFLFVSLYNFTYTMYSWSYPPQFLSLTLLRVLPTFMSHWVQLVWPAWAWATRQWQHLWWKMMLSPQLLPAANGFPAGGGVSGAPHFMLDSLISCKSPAGHWCCCWAWVLPCNVQKIVHNTSHHPILTVFPNGPWALQGGSRVMFMSYLERALNSHVSSKCHLSVF